MFEQEIIQDKFPEFHPGMYKNFMGDSRWREIYFAVKSGRLTYADIKNNQYTDRKTLNGCWNEQARDYLEFMAFTGLLPSYYKGRNSNSSEKRHYVGQTLKLYKQGLFSYSDILFKMKFRNVSKNYDDIEQYNVRNRPFVVAIKIMNILQQHGFEYIDPASLSYLIRTTSDEDNIDVQRIAPVDFAQMPEVTKREASRGATFLKRHLISGLGFCVVKLGQAYVFDVRRFNINDYRFKERAIFIGDYYWQEGIEVTPMLIKALLNPAKIADEQYRQKLLRLGMIDKDGALYDFNIDTDLPDINLAKMVSSDMAIHASFKSRVSCLELTDNFKTGKAISESGDGTKYEEFLYRQLLNKFGEHRVKHYGAQTTGQRLSDIVCSLDILNTDGSPAKLKIIIESKSGGAIAAFDERKELDDILRTLSKERGTEYNGIWYMVIDSNRIPAENSYGGYRANTGKLSFKQKLLKIQSSVMVQSLRFTMVTAFSYTEFMRFLDAIDCGPDTDYLSSVLAPDFWTWSNKFITDSYVTIRA